MQSKSEICSNITNNFINNENSLSFYNDVNKLNDKFNISKYEKYEKFNINVEKELASKPCCSSKDNKCSII